MALPRNPITQPGGPSQPSISDLVDRGQYVRTNRDNQGSWREYLNAIRKTGPDYSVGNATFFETPADRANRPSRPGPIKAGQLRGESTGTPVRGGGNANIGSTPTRPLNYGPARQVAPGSPEANYTAGIRRYGAGMRSAPNIGAVRNKAGYNERDRKLAARNSGATLATGDALTRVRTLGG